MLETREDGTQDRQRKAGILVRTALLSWLVTLVTMGVFIAGVLPSQKQTFIENLESKAHGVSVSLQDVAAGAVVTEDYSEVVDHCMEVLAGDGTIEFLVLTRKDGFSLAHTRDGWTSEQMDELWRPLERKISGGMAHPDLVDRDVFKYSRPFDYSGIEWGWIHVGLSLNAYRENVRNSYTRTAWLGGICILMGLVASIVYAKRLVAPILRLQHAAQEVASGNLDARANVNTGDEVEALAQDFNKMTQAVQDREARVRTQNMVLASLVTDSALHAGDILTAAGRITSASAQTLDVQRTSIWLFRQDQSGIECLDQFDNESGTHSRGALLEREGTEAYFSALEDARTLSAEDAIHDPRTACLADKYLQPHGIISMMDAPIRMGGRIVGIVCHEHVGETRSWSLEEENFVGSVADLIALALEARDRRAVQDELLAAKEAAEAASEAKSQFLANMSHEIRTPINGVMGMLQLLERDDLSLRQKRHVTTALNSADTLLSVIGDVLDFSKIEAGHLELDSSEFELRDAVDRGVRLLADKAQSKGVELTYTVSPDVPDEVVGDSSRLRQVLINLVGNAVKFTEAGEIHVDCQLAEQSETHAAIRVSVRDTGPGIPAEQRDNIFLSFAQGDASMRRRHGGTGLGLAISRHIVELMGGNISVESTPGEGATFTFTARLELSNTTATASEPRNMGTKGLRVLVVDDSETARGVSVNYARSWGCEVEEASDASDALQALREGAAAGDPFAVAILDADMPGVDGQRAAKLIKGLAELDDTVLILLSGPDMPSEDEMLRSGFRAMVAKPVRASDLYNAIVAAVDGGTMVGPGTAGRVTNDVPVAAPGARILIVEDNGINREVAREMLLDMRHTCDCLTTGAEALDAVASGRYDLVLMDCQMPGMDGYEATAGIRAWERQNRPGRPVPIIALTAHAMQGDRDRCLAAGMDDYLSKPLQADELGAMLGRWLGGNEKDAGRTVLEEPAPPASSCSIGDDKSLEAAVIARCSGNRALAVKLLNDFIDQTEEDIAAISTALKAGDPERLANAAHRLKGAAGNLALHTAEAAAAELVVLGRAGRTEGANTWIETLRAEAELVAAMPILAQTGGSAK
jgi:signal transduction histidine kinase/DNA-binding response OmpR family regulator/HAMP domain-containing protein